jgi:mannose-6-phosphate isomerase-like protein (cupin superfamily)
MKKWSDNEGVEFRNSDLCFGREYKTDTGSIDIAKISIRGQFPQGGWGYLEESHEMAVITRGHGYIETKDGEREELIEGDVVYIEPMKRFRWGGDMDMIVPCGPAFDPRKHKLEEA